MGESDPMRTLVREIILAAGMITILVLAMWAHTGSMPPLVVVESNSMQHDENGELGTIDAGDLVLVHAPDNDRIITFVEASNPESSDYGYESLGMEGDVIIYERNGESESTPIIHRALFKVEIGETTPLDDQGNCQENATLWDGQCIITWTVPGSDQVNVGKINLLFDGNNTGEYSCNGVPGHASSKWYSVEDYKPPNPGYITLGDNNNCDDDHDVSMFASCLSIDKGVCRPVQEEWVIGISGAEIPWVGIVKLMVSGGDSPGISQVPGASILYLILLIGAVLATPMLIEPLINKILRNSPEMIKAEQEDAIALIHSSEEE
ncbi:MAG: S26 family signal peptidase [Candidatus Poseidoniales archaeon]|nr:MAG: S26 family signal peptidase [Candidatus Poseidoniales archaeon]